MEDGLAGVPGLAAISVVVVDVLFGLGPAPAPHPRMVGRNAKERKIRSNPATPSPVVRLIQHIHSKIEHPNHTSVQTGINSACLNFKKSAQSVVGIIDGAWHIFIHFLDEKTCPPAQEFVLCAKQCPQSCADLQQGIECQEGGECQPGCRCPEGNEAVLY